MTVGQSFAAWRRLGPRRGTYVALTKLTAPARARLRAARLRLRPLRVSDDEIREALGGADPRRQLREVVLEALPTVQAFRRRLIQDQELRAAVLELAGRLAAHRFDLLGSGPVDLGPEIDWQRDFKSGRRWPLEHISRLIISYPDDSDIKVPWELSRFQHLPVLAAAYRITLERRWIEEIGAELCHWIEANPVEFGANWACTMDVAIRAANWTASLAMIDDDAPCEPWFDTVIGSLLLHGRFIRSHLEWAAARGNHYLSDLVGLLAVAALFSQGVEGREWASFAVRELGAELGHQVREDGCDHEASIPYHRLVTELFVCGAQAAGILAPGELTAGTAWRIDAMLGFTRDYTRPDGLAPQVGDADDGRYLPLWDYGRLDPRSHLHLFEQAGVVYSIAEGHAAYPHGGYWIMRYAELFVIIRCGDVGVYGTGSHAHNDALSFELAWGSEALVVDPGSYLYTADPGARNLFRSTAFHSTLQLDGAEQNPLDEKALFVMEDQRQAEATLWDVSDPLRPVFEGRHSGYGRLPEPAVHTRRIELDSVAARLLITDSVTSAGAHHLDWTFPLNSCEATADGPRASARFSGGLALELTGDGLEFRVEDGWISPSYGRRIETRFLRASKQSGPPEDVSQIVMTIRS